jgi:hypothetical protein
MRWTGRLLAILLTVVPATVVAAAGSAAPVSEASQPPPIVLNLKFKPVARLGDGGCGPRLPVSTSGHYALVSISSPKPGACISSFVLIDDRTGKRTVIHTSGFTDLLAFGAPWIFLLKNGHDALYNIDTKTTHSCGASGCVNAPNGDAVGYAAGGDWIETFIQQPGPCGDGVHNGCGPITESFYNIKTGHFRYSSSTGSTTIADLDSPTLFQRVCRPLQVPPGPYGGIVYGATLFTPLAFFGSFAVATATNRNWLLERCGSHLQIPIGMTYQDGPVSPPVASTHAVVWPVIDPRGEPDGQLAGVLLPSLRPFTAGVPSNLEPVSAPIALSAFRLYIVANGRLWAATIPR